MFGNKYRSGVILLNAVCGFTGFSCYRTITGLTMGTTKAHLMRATLEGICFQAKDVIQAMQSDTGNFISSLNVDGGLSVSDTFLNILTEICNLPVGKCFFLFFCFRNRHLLSYPPPPQFIRRNKYIFFFFLLKCVYFKQYARPWSKLRLLAPRLPRAMPSAYGACTASSLIATRFHRLCPKKVFSLVACRYCRRTHA